GGMGGWGGEGVGSGCGGSGGPPGQFVRAWLPVGGAVSNPATHPTGPWRAPGAAASACGATYGVWGSLTPVAGTAATGSFLERSAGLSAFASRGPTHQGPVVYAGNVRGGGGRGGEGAALGGRAAHPFLVPL